MWRKVDSVIMHSRTCRKLEVTSLWCDLVLTPPRQKFKTTCTLREVHIAPKAALDQATLLLLSYLSLCATPNNAFWQASIFE